jgi:hypothetical protein
VNGDPPSATDHGSAVTLNDWQQGDCALNVSGFLYRFAREHPATPESRDAADASDVVEVDTSGFVVVTQTCDIQRAVADRPFVVVCALVECPDWADMDEIKKGMRPRFVHIPVLASRGLVADLDQVMTIEKPLLISWPRIRGCQSDSEQRAFAAAVSRKFLRFAFPDDLVAVVADLTTLIKRKHGRPESDEGKALRELREIRVAATPDWTAENVELYFLFIRREDQGEALRQPWAHWLEKWLSLEQPTTRYFKVHGVVLPLSQIRADEYAASDQLDLDHLSPNVD